jgi:SLOG cluster3 family
MGLIPGDIIFLSASVPYRAPWTADAQPVAIEEAIVSIARAIFARRGRLLFGGHPSVSPLIASIAGEYFRADPHRVVRPVITFQSELFRGRLPDETWTLHELGWASIHWIEAVEGNQDASLELMRRGMLMGERVPESVPEQDLRPPRAMIAVGGMQGILDEARIFVEPALAPKPIFAFTSGNGATLDLTDPPRLRDYLRNDQVVERILPRVVAVEDRFRATHRGMLPEDLPVEPYAAMAQWLMDIL